MESTFCTYLNKFKIVQIKSSALKWHFGSHLISKYLNNINWLNNWYQFTLRERWSNIPKSVNKLAKRPEQITLQGVSFYPVGMANAFNTSSTRAAQVKGCFLYWIISLTVWNKNSTLHYLLLKCNLMFITWMGFFFCYKFYWGKKGRNRMF